MRRHPAPAARLTRLSLLIAALLQIAGSAVGPWAHLSLLPYLQGAPSVTTAQYPDGVPGPPDAHDELTCVFCHTLTAAVVPVALDASLAVLVSRGREISVPSGRSGLHPPRAASARAPPSA